MVNKPLEKLTDKIFRRKTVTLLFTILICIVVMAASAFSLFYIDLSTYTSTITGAYYSVTVDKAVDRTHICPLAYEDKHIFEIKANGNATTGYCEVKIGDQVYYTEEIPNNSSLLLTVQAAMGTEISFTPKWGEIPEETCGNEIIHSVTPYAVYEVEPTAKISDIAKYYEVSRSNILIYNDLSEKVRSPKLPIGTTLKIPGVTEAIPPYTVPYGIYVVEPTARLGNIAEFYGISKADILEYNNISADEIGDTDYSSTDFSVGFELKIPGVKEDDPAYAVPYAKYTVEPTANIYDISRHYGVSSTDILLYNDIRKIKVGTNLKIPGVSPRFPAYEVSYATYTVEEYATFEGISEYYGVSEEDIKLYNDIDELIVGYEMKIPGVPTDTESYIAPVPEIIENKAYKLISESLSDANEADFIIYEGIEYAKELDSYITGIKASDNDFCELSTNVENLSLCFEINKRIEQGYLKIIIGDNQYYTLQLSKDSYVRLDILALIGTKIRFEAYEGISEASLNGEMLIGDDLMNNEDGNEPILEHISDH